MTGLIARMLPVLFFINFVILCNWLNIVELKHTFVTTLLIVGGMHSDAKLLYGAILSFDVVYVSSPIIIM